MGAKLVKVWCGRAKTPLSLWFVTLGLPGLANVVGQVWPMKFPGDKIVSNVLNKAGPSADKFRQFVN
jgi:hypothetical protein